MADGIFYLDVDDEITSAAARIRGSAGPRVALVVPHGSRISTSRMNFRLLSREAIVNNRRLSIVAADPASRALAASAGLPAFATVAEYESALAGPAADAFAAAPKESPAGPRKRPRKKSSQDEAQAIALPLPPDDSPTVATPVAAVALEPGADALPPPPPPVVSPAAPPAAPPTQPVRLPVGPLRPPAVAAKPDPPAVASGGSRVLVRPGRPALRIETPILVAAAVAVLAVVVMGVGGYLFLPSADIRLTPREEPIGPISMVVRADPDAASPDPVQGVVPAKRLELPVEVSDTFTTAGRRIQEAAASGEVVFSSFNTAQNNTVPAGSIVATGRGIQFRTLASVTLPPATRNGLQIRPSTARAPVRAVKAGTSGNVAAKAITVVPSREDPDLTEVSNPAATSGGTRKEFPQVSQGDLDAALVALRTALSDAFTTEVASGFGAPAGATVFAGTATLGEPTPTVDPATLLGTEAATFELGLRADGTVIAVDESPVNSIAETKLLANVGADHRLVEGSINIVIDDATVSLGEVSFPVTARAARVRILDPAQLLTEIKGQPVDEARRFLDRYGEAEIVTWPEWVSSIPGLDARLTLVIVGQDASPPPASPAGGSGEPTSSPAP